MTGGTDRPGAHESVTIGSRACIHPIGRFRNLRREFPESEELAIWDIFSNTAYYSGTTQESNFMSNEAVNSVSNDPLKAVADALDAAVQTAKGGVADVKASASSALPALSGFLSDITYKSCYAVSYGIAFPTFLAVRAIPKENAAVKGFIDGAAAAIDLVDGIKAKSL
jgi:hypothetical protein